MGFGRTTNGELAAMLQSLAEKSDERHEQNLKRLDELIGQAKITNGRIGEAEKDIIRISGRVDALEDKPTGGKGQTIRLMIGSGGAVGLWELVKHWFGK